MNLFFIERYIQKIRKEDIYNYAMSQGIILKTNELDILYNYLKSNYKSFLHNKESRTKLLEDIKSKLPSNIAYKLDELYYQYKDKI